MVTVGELIKSASSSIARSDAGVILGFLLNMERSKLPLYRYMAVDERTEAEFHRLVGLRKTGCPVAYIIGRKEFYSLPFIVSPAVLIPRPDTETLVEWGIDRAREGFTDVLDLCCGSGCIGISVGHYVPGCRITLMDISSEALEIAEENARMHSVSASFKKLDILSEEICGRYNLILSNPPYIESGQIPTLQKDVSRFEPRIALDGGDDGLSFYPEIIKKSARALTGGGYLGLEVGHLQGESVADLMSGYFYDIKILPDLCGHLRVVTGRRKE